MKGKYTMTICLGLIAMILTIVILAQFKTVDETDITAIETMRETELRSELAGWKEKYDTVEQQLKETQEKITEYKSALNNNTDSSETLQKEVKEAEAYLGYSAVQGEGIILTLSDNEMYTIEYVDLLRIVNMLNAAGAEAISINDERIVSTSDITVINYGMILTNTKKITSPYVIKAVGDKKYLESTLNIKGDLIDELKLNGKTLDYTVEDNIIINAYDGEINFKYATENVVNKEV